MKTAHKLRINFFCQLKKLIMAIIFLSNHVAGYSVSINNQYPVATGMITLSEVINNQRQRPPDNDQKIVSDESSTQYSGLDNAGSRLNLASSAFQMFSTNGISHINSTDSNTIPANLCGAVGPGHLVSTAGNHIYIQDKWRIHLDNNGTILPLATFCSSVSASPSPLVSIFSARIEYDYFGRRWIFTAAANRGLASSCLLIGVSKDSDPTGIWKFYRYDFDAANLNWLNDPVIGYNNPWVCISVNAQSISTNAVVRSELFLFKKSDLYGFLLNPLITRFNNLNGRNVIPAITHDNSTLTPIYLVSTASTGSIRLHKIQTVNGAPTYSNNLPTGANMSWAKTFAGVPQPQTGDELITGDSAKKIFVGDDRIKKVIYRNGSIWCTHTVFLPAINPQRAAVQWWQISIHATLVQRGLIQSTDPLLPVDFANPSMDVDKDDKVVIGYSMFSHDYFPSAGYSIRIGTDSLNTMRTPHRYYAGLYAYNRPKDGLNMWGQSSTVCIDPTKFEFAVLQMHAGNPVITGSGNSTVSPTFDTITTWATRWALICTAHVPFQLIVTDKGANKAFYYSKQGTYVTNNILSTSIVNATTNVTDMAIDYFNNKHGAFLLDGTNKRVYFSTVTGKAAQVSKTLKTQTGLDLIEPTGLDVEGDSLWVLDKGNNAIYAYGLSESFSGTGVLNATSKTNLHPGNTKAESLRVLDRCDTVNAIIPARFCVLDNNTPKRIYVYSRTNRSLVAISGALTAPAGSPALTNATGLEYNVDFLGDSTNLTGEYIRTFYVVDSGTDRCYSYFEDHYPSINYHSPSMVFDYSFPLASGNSLSTGICIQSPNHAYTLGAGMLREQFVDDTPEIKTVQGIRSYPNPTSGSFRLVVENLGSGNTIVQIFEMTGRLLRTIQVEEGRIISGEIEMDMADLSPGNYLISVITDDTRKSLIVQKQ